MALCILQFNMGSIAPTSMAVSLLFYIKEVCWKIMDMILAIILIVAAAAAGIGAGFGMGYVTRKKSAEREIGSAEKEAFRIALEAWYIIIYLYIMGND